MKFAKQQLQDRQTPTKSAASQPRDAVQRSMQPTQHMHSPDHLKYLQRTIGNQAVMQFLKSQPGWKPAQEPVQRKLMVNGTTYIKKTRRQSLKMGEEDVYDLITSMSYRYKEFEMTKGAIKEINSMATDGIDHTFTDYDKLFEDLYQKEFFFKKATSSHGPKGLGSRPSFYDKANQMEYGWKDNVRYDRRHVFASSTLGIAIEKSDASIEEVSNFLKKFGEDPESSNLPLLKTQAWKLVHSHVGNLWVGQGEVNSAIGFIRAPMEKIVQELEKYKDPTVDYREILKNLDTPQGPLRTSGRKHWLSIVKVIEQQFEENADNFGQIRIPAAIGILEDAIVNCDVDIPDTDFSEDNGATKIGKLRSEYFEILEDIYTQLTDDSTNVFETGGALYKFMELDWRNFKES